jgi:hypothetical protein
MNGEVALGSVEVDSIVRLSGSEEEFSGVVDALCDDRLGRMNGMDARVYLAEYRLGG